MYFVVLGKLSFLFEVVELVKVMQMLHAKFPLGYVSVTADALEIVYRVLS